MRSSMLTWIDADTEAVVGQPWKARARSLGEGSWSLWRSWADPGCRGWMVFDKAKATLSGTPTQPGSYWVTLRFDTIRGKPPVLQTIAVEVKKESDDVDQE